MSRFLSWALLALGLAAAVGAFLWWQGSKRGPPPSPPRPPFVIPATLASVERGTLEAKVSLTGTVRSLRHARLGFAIGGSVGSIDVRAGDLVKKDAPVAALDDRDQAARLASARADTALARAELAALEAGARPEEVHRLAAQAEAAEADVSWTRAEVERLKPLASGRVVSVSAYEEMVAKRDSARGRLEAARAALALAKAGAREEDLAVQRSRVSTREAAEALVQREVEKTRLLAPFDGQVVRRLAAPGDAVNAGQAVLELVDLVHREVELEIPARHASRMGPRPRVDLTVDENPGFALTAELDARVDDADDRSRSFRALVRLGDGRDDEGALKPGTFVRATLHLDPLVDRLLVPTDAVRIVEQGPIVVKAVPPPDAQPAAGTPPAGSPPPGAPRAPSMPPPWKAEWIPVRLLGAEGGRTAVEPVGPPLVPGDRVVVVSVDRMFPGAPILPREAGGAPPPGAVAPAPAASASKAP